jgi:hypothetical protein
MDKYGEILEEKLLARPVESLAECSRACSALGVPLTTGACGTEGDVGEDVE